MSETNVETAAKPTLPDRSAAEPSFELWTALAVGIVPQLASFVIGGYGRLVVIGPLALTLTLADIAAAVVAGLQLRADQTAHRSSHPVVWITLVLAGLWLVYALSIGAVLLMGRVFCVNETCRGPLG